jgi:hypothetical protein
MLGVSYYSYIVAMDCLPAEVHSTFLVEFPKLRVGEMAFLRVFQPKLHRTVALTPQKKSRQFFYLF